LREVFGERNVHLISISPHFDKIRSSTFIVLTGRDEVSIKDFESYLKNRHEGQAISAVVPENILNDYLKRTYSVVLRDEYAPVDNLHRPLYLKNASATTEKTARPLILFAICNFQCIRIVL